MPKDYARQSSDHNEDFGESALNVFSELPIELCLAEYLLNLSMIHPVNQCPAVLCFGEILWDVVNGRELIGGAPFNLAAHLGRLGVHSFIYSRVGSDLRGARARHCVARVGGNDRWLQQDDRRPTGWVDVTLDGSGQPTFQIGSETAWDAIKAPQATIEELRQQKFVALVCGTLAQRASASREALKAIRVGLPEVPVFYDVNLRGRETPMERVSETLPGVTLLKVNAEEASMVSQSIFGQLLTPANLFAKLRERYGIKVMLCTRGADGCEVHAEGQVVTGRAEAVRVASAVGAGDAFSAAFLASWVKGLGLETAVANASVLGAFVAASPETIPDYSAELLRRLRGLS